MSSQIICGKCEENYCDMSYEENGEYWCEECYTMEYHPDEFGKMEYLRMEKCSHCFESVEELYDVDCCHHKFCIDCFDYVCKINTCVECYKQVLDDYEPNTDICKACYNQYYSCNCYKRVSIDKDELFANGLFITFQNKINHKVLRRVVDICESRYGYKDFEDIKLDEIDFEEDGSKGYIVSVPNKKFNSNNNENEFVKIIIEFYTEEEMDEKALEYIEENICYFHPNFIFHHLKEGIFKQIIESDEKSDPEKIWDNEACPICLECYDETIEKTVGCCGHTLCKGCFNHIIKSNNSVCPECREVWNDITDGQEFIKWELEDIVELCVAGDFEALNEIVDNESLKDESVLRDGYASIFGYDDCNFYDDVKFRNESSDHLYIIDNSF